MGRDSRGGRLHFFSLVLFSGSWQRFFFFSFFKFKFRLYWEASSTFFLFIFILFSACFDIHLALLSLGKQHFFYFFCVQLRLRVFGFCLSAFWVALFPFSVPAFLRFCLFGFYAWLEVLSFLELSPFELLGISRNQFF